MSQSKREMLPCAGCVFLYVEYPSSLAIPDALLNSWPLLLLVLCSSLIAAMLIWIVVGGGPGVGGEGGGAGEEVERWEKRNEGKKDGRMGKRGRKSTLI